MKESIRKTNLKDETEIFPASPACRIGPVSDASGRQWIWEEYSTSTGSTGSSISTSTSTNTNTGTNDTTKFDKEP